MNSSSHLKRLMRYAQPYWFALILALLSMTVVAITEAAFPALMKPLMDNGFQGAADFQIWWVPLSVLGIFFVRGIASFTVTYLMQWVSNNVLRDLRQSMFLKLLSLPTSFFDKTSSGHLITKLIVDVNQVMSITTSIVTIVVRDSLIFLGLLGWLFWLNWKLTLVILVLAPALVFSSVQFSKRMRRLSEKSMAIGGDMTVVVEQAISGSRIIKLFDGARREANRFFSVNSAVRGQSMRLAVAQGLQTPISQFIAAVGVAAILTMALFQSRLGETTTGEFVSFITAMLMMFGPLRHLTDVNSQLQRGLVAAKSLFVFLDEKGELDSGAREVIRSRGEIKFDRVTFAYPGRKTAALQDISLIVRSGETVAFVGPSGGGKTSLVSLLPRLYETTWGKIFLDDIPISDITLESLRKQFAVVSQDVFVFNDTIRHNIGYGLTPLDDSKIIDALDRADLSQFIDSLPDGLNTFIGDRGVRLSGGQRQRMAIARAFLKDAPVLILDEATSALDNVTEARIKNSIDALRKNRTTLIIAHRLSTVINADRIIVIERGAIAQQGTHFELIQTEGPYQKLYREMKDQASQTRRKSHE